MHRGNGGVVHLRADGATGFARALGFAHSWDRFVQAHAASPDVRLSVFCADGHPADCSTGQTVTALLRHRVNS